MRATATRRFSAERIEVPRRWFSSKGFEMPLEVFRVERKIEEGQPESQNQTCHRKDQPGDGQTAAFVKFGMPVDLRQPETRKPRIANVTAGLSGPAIKPIAVRMVYDAAHAVKI